MLTGIAAAPAGTDCGREAGDGARAVEAQVAATAADARGW